MNPNAVTKSKNPDSVYLLISSAFSTRKYFATQLDSALKLKKIDYGFSDNIFRYSMICIIEPRAGAQNSDIQNTPQCEEAAILAYIDVDAWNEIPDIRGFCSILSKYSLRNKEGLEDSKKPNENTEPDDDEDNENDGVLLKNPRVHLILGSVKERVSAKKLDKWTVELYEDFIADVVIKYHFDLAEFSSENEAAQYISEICEAYSELRERRKADMAKKILSVASKGIKGSGGENKLLTTWMAGLACIPGVSENKARAIAKEYPTMKSLMDKYLQADTKEFGLKEKEELLNGIKYTGTGEDKGNKIGKKLSKRVYDYFTCMDPNAVLN